MSVVVRYRPEGLTRGQYDEVTRRINEAGAWPPHGLQMHVLFGVEGDLKVARSGIPRTSTGPSANN